jgi:lipopolysaccharide export system protein LptA
VNYFYSHNRFILFILLSFTLSADNDDRLKILQAGSLERMEMEGEKVQQFVGDVILQRGTMTLYTDKAIHYLNRNEYHLLGSVKLVDETDTLLSKSMFFYNDRVNYLKAMDDIFFTQDNQVITCDSLLYWTELDSGLAMGNVIMMSKMDTMTATTFNYWKTDGYRGTSFVTSGGTKIYEDEKVIVAESISYDDNEQFMSLNVGSSLEEPGKGISGNNIHIQYNDSLIQSIFVDGQTHAYQDMNAMLYSGDTGSHKFTDNMSASYMSSFFEDGEMYELNLIGMATTKYNVVKDSLLQGLNKATGDTITVSFEDGDMNRIQVFGGGRGVFEPEVANSRIDSVITYQADYLDYHVDEQITYLENDASVDYQGTKLSAGFIKSNWNTDMLDARLKGDVYPTIDSPTSDPMSGDQMEFNLLTHHGRVTLGKTRLNQGYYYGKEIFRDDPNIFHVTKSRYTSCDLDRPHFHLASRKMKMITGDKVVARPIILSIYDIPLFGIPLAVFPNKGGERHSGWIMPSFGHSKSAGTYFHGLGYYWAPNDYLDGKVLFNFRDQQGFDVKGKLNYVKRYKFSGNISSDIFRNVDSNEIADIFKDNVSKQWRIHWNHNHRIDPTQNVIIDANYVSDNKINQDYGYDLKTRLEQRLRSQAIYSKHWASTKNSLSLTLSEDFDLLAAESLPSEKSKSPGDKLIERTRTFPSISFSHSLTQVFGNGPKWYNSIYWRMSSLLTARQAVNLVAATDSTWFQDRTYDRTYQARHNFTLTSPQKVSGWLTLSPSFKLTSDWVFKYRKAQLDESGAFVKDSVTSVIVYDEIEKFLPRNTFTLSISANTKMYGTFPVRIGKLDAIRHVMTPNISFSWKPDFSKNVLGADPGYFQRDVNGEKFDKFTGSTAGSTSSRESKTIGYSLRNEFQTKYLISEDTYSKETIATWNMNGSYNATADSLRFSPISSGIRAGIPGGMDIDVSMSHNLYKLKLNPDISKLVPVDEFSSYPRLTSLSIGTSLRLSGTSLIEPDLSTDPVEPDTIYTGALLDEGVQLDTGIESAAPSIGRANLWEATLGLRYSLNKRVEGEEVVDDKTYWMNTNLTLRITRNWVMRYNARINMLERELVTHSFDFYRELHCWELRFQWWPSGGGKGFMLRINVKNPDLQDIKLKSTGGSIWRF